MVNSPLVAVSITYLALVSGVMIWRGISVSPDYLLLILVPVALLSGRAFVFLRDWVPFVALFLGYEALSGVAPKLGIGPQVGSMVRIKGRYSRAGIPARCCSGTSAGCTGFSSRAPSSTSATSCSPSRWGWCCGWSTVRSSCVSPWRCWPCRSPPSSSSCCCPRRRRGTRTTWDCCQGCMTWCTGRCPVRSAPTSSGWTPTRWRRSPRSTRLTRRWAHWRSGRSAGRTALVMVPWCLAVWFSVVFLGQHYVIDVTGGVVLGRNESSGTPTGHHLRSQASDERLELLSAVSVPPGQPGPSVPPGQPGPSVPVQPAVRSSGPAGPVRSSGPGGPGTARGCPAPADYRAGRDIRSADLHLHEALEERPVLAQGVTETLRVGAAAVPAAAQGTLAFLDGRDEHGW